MTAQQDEPAGPPRQPGQPPQDPEQASTAELLAELADVEEAIRSAARAGYPPTAGLSEREDAIVEALRRRCGPTFRGRR